jgi:hypothetical protein
LKMPPALAWRTTIAFTPMILACGRSPSVERVDSAAATAPVARANSIAQRSGLNTMAACPPTGRWAICSVEKRLKSAGLVARKIDGESPARAGFSVKPVAYTLGRDSRLELFIYPTETALQRDFSAIDTVSVAPPGQKGSWALPPTLIRSGNLAAVLLSRDAREVDRVSLALTAGAPQPR